MKLDGEKFRLFDELLSNYSAVADVLQLSPATRSRIEGMGYEQRIGEVFRCWDDNAPQLADGQYPHTWQGLWDILEDSGLEEKARQFFDFLNRHES